MKTCVHQKRLFALKKEKSAHHTGTNAPLLGKIAPLLGNSAPRLEKGVPQMGQIDPALGIFVLQQGNLAPQTGDAVSASGKIALQMGTLAQHKNIFHVMKLKRSLTSKTRTRTQRIVARILMLI